MSFADDNRRFPVNCPYCKRKVSISGLGWMDILDDLDTYGKTVVECSPCNKLFIIREEDDTGPFIQAAAYKEDSYNVLQEK